MIVQAKDAWRRVLTHWNWSDTAVFGPNICAFGLLVGNCWWHSLAVVYWTVGGALLLQATRVGRDPALRRALAFGGLTALIWAGAEWAFTQVTGWWGEYLVMGPAILDTPVYTVMIAWLANSYLVYVERRTRDLGYGTIVSGVLSVVGGFCLGIIGENLYVSGRMWVYHPSALDWWGVPAFIPISYALAAATLPWASRRSVPVAAVAYEAATVCAGIGLGLLIGFYPR
jgi:hypothetical protein